MKSSSLPSALFILTIYLFNGICADIVNETCKKAVGPNLTYQYCVASLNSDPSSVNADLQGLGVISMKLSKAKVNSVKSHIQTLIGQGDNPPLKNALGSCNELYSDAIPDIDDAIMSMTNAKDYQGANIKMSAASDAASTCEDGFKEVKQGSPLTKENDDISHVTAISLAITNMLLQSNVTNMFIRMIE